MVDLSLPEKPDWSASALDRYERSGLLQRDAELMDVVVHCRGRLVYLATPFTDRVTDECGGFCLISALDYAQRGAKVSRCFAIEGVTAISPIVNAVDLVCADQLDEALDPLDRVFWARWCWPLLSAADVVVVPPIEGWQDSSGIWAEVSSALSQNKRVYLIGEGA